MSEVLVCQRGKATPRLEHCRGNHQQVPHSLRAAEMKSVHDHPLLLRISPSHTTQQSNAHGSWGPHRCCGGHLISRWQLSVLTQKPKPDFLLRQKKRLPVPRAYSTACGTPPQVSFTRVLCGFCCWWLVTGKVLGTKFAFCSSSQQGLSACPRHGHYFRLLLPLWEPQCETCSVHPEISSCEEDTLFWPTLFSFLVSLLFLFLYSALRDSGWHRKVTVATETAALCVHRMDPWEQPRSRWPRWHPLVWLVRAAQPASPSGHVLHHSVSLTW